MDFKNKPIFGMIHLAGNGGINMATSRALEEIKILEEEGVGAIIIENYHGSIEDMVDILSRLEDTKLIVGLNVLPNEYSKAFEMAKTFKCKFIQLDYVSGNYERSKVINEFHYLSIRKDYPGISVLGGVWPKYYVPVKNSVLKNDIELGMQRAEAIVVTGAGTGKETPLEKVKEFRNIMGEFPLIVGAGLNSTNVAEQLSIADGAIVGSTFKRHGITTEKIDRALVKEFMNEVKKIRYGISTEH